MRITTENHTLRGALVLALVAASAAVITASQPACAPKRCDFDERTPDKAVVSIQCPSGDVCYQGDCRRACEPGREQATPCTDDSECKDPALPHCVSSAVLNASFCSSCEGNDVCIPQLGICQSVVEIPLPEQPTPTRQAPPPLPLDGGSIDGSVFEEADAGTGPVVRNVTHAGYVLLARGVAGGAGGGATPTGFEQLEVAFFDVRAATSTRSVDPIAAAGQCELILPTTYIGTTTPADLGTVRIESSPGTPDALDSTINLTFDPQLARYDAMSVPSPLFNFSVLPGQNQFVTLYSPGITGLSRPWPSVGTFHLPYQLQPDMGTQQLMASPIVVPDPPEDLTVRWAQIPPNGAIGGEYIGLRIQGGLHELRCREPEGVPNTLDHITVPASLLTAYATVEGLMPGDQRQLVFERIFEQGLQIDPDAEDVAIDVTLTITHAYVTQMQF